MPAIQWLIIVLIAGAWLLAVAGGLIALLPVLWLLALLLTEELLTALSLGLLALLAGELLALAQWLLSWPLPGRRVALGAADFLIVAFFSHGETPIWPPLALPG